MTVRLGVIGHGGRISRMIIGSFRKEEPELRVVGIVDPDEPGARTRLEECDQKDVVFYKDVEEMVRGARLDALAIGTQCNLHTPYALQVAKYDLPLFIEKPVAVSMEQAVALEEAFENSRCRTVVSFPMHVSPLCRRTREIIESGGIGTPEHVMAFNYVPYGRTYYEDWYRDYNVTQGLFVQKATHDFDALDYLMGSRIVRVGAMATWGRIFGGTEPAGMRCSRCPKADDCIESTHNRARNNQPDRLSDHACVFGEDLGTPKTGMNEDSSSALIEFADGVHGVYTQVFFVRRTESGTRGARISGYDGSVHFDWYTNEVRHIRHHSPFTDVSSAEGGMNHFGGDAVLGQNFLDVIRGKAESSTPIRLGVQSIYVCLAARESARTDRFVTVRQVGGTGV